MPEGQPRNLNSGFQLEGRVCVVTGAAGGIGRGIAQALSAEGAKVAILDRNVAGANETLALVQQAGGIGIALGCDVTDRHSIDDAEAAITQQLGAIQVLANNAGTIRPGALDSRADLRADGNRTLRERGPDEARARRERSVRGVD